MDKTAEIGTGGDAYPGEEPQAQADAGQLRHDYTVAEPVEPDRYNWAMSGTHVAVSDDHHGTQFDAMGWNDFSRPHAYGEVELHYRWTAFWHVIYANMSLSIVEKRLKRYTKDQGWEWGGILDDEGMPYQLTALRQSSVEGIGETNPGVKDWKNNDWSGMQEYDNPGDHQSETPFYGFSDYDEDFPMTDPRTCSECGAPCLNYDDWRKHILRNHVNPDRTPPAEPQPVVDLDQVLPANFNEFTMDKTVQRQSRLIYQLTAENPRRMYSATQPMYHVAYARDRQSILRDGLQPADPGAGWSDGHENPAGVYMWDSTGDALAHADYKADAGLDGGPFDIWRIDTTGIEVFPDPMSHGGWYTPTGIPPARLSLWNERTSAMQPPTIPGPIPFIYDIETDRIYVGHPGERHSDIQGRFTPGGIIEGQYDPRGQVQIRTDTDMPYTVRHMAELWYALHPELAIRGIFLMVGEKKYKLASANIGHQVRNIAAADPAAWAAFQALEPLGNVYAVGGAVRDIVLGKTPKDVDLMVQGVEPNDVQDALEQLPGRVDYTGKQFGVFRYRDPEGNEVEIALPRTERSTGPGHRDFEVVTNPYISVGEDLARRDFTGNAMAVNLATGDLVDPYRGSEDLKSGVLKTVSDRSFIEDPLRILRAFGSVARHGLDPSPETYHDLAAHAGLLSELPRERVQMELDKLMSGSDPAKAVDLMEATGVLQHVLPEVAATTGFDQRSQYHAHLLSDHLKEVLRYVASQTDDVDLRWAALLHDIGKPASQWIDGEGFAHYYENDKGEGANHDRVGANMAHTLLTDLKFPNDRIDRIVHLINHHMFPAFSSAAGARKFINRVGNEHADDLLALREADAGGKGSLWDGDVPIMRQYVDAVRAAGEPTDVSALAINGNDLIQAGFKPGPEMGQTLRYLTERVLEDPSLNNRDTLLALAQQSEGEPVANTQTVAKFGKHAADDNYIEALAEKILAECKDDEIPEESHARIMDLFRAYALLALSKGEKTTAEDVHDAWAAWVAGFDPEHESLVPFAELTKKIQAYDKPYVRYIHKHARLANILDPIQDALDPDVFNHADAIEPVVKPKIAEWVKKKVYKTMIDAGWPDPSKYLTMVLTGSLTTYQWSAESDFDISLWVDVERFPEWVRADLIAMMIEKCDGTIVPGTTHPIQCFVVDSKRFTKADLYKKGLRSGYDLDEGRWLVLPERDRSIDVSKRWPEHIRYAKDCVEKMKMMLRYDKYAVKVYWDFLHRQRFLDQRAGKGDYSVSNIVYKMLSNEGLFPAISEVTGEHIA